MDNKRVARELGGVMNTRRIAGELVKIAKSMVGVDAGRKRYNYDMSQNIVDAFVLVPGIDGAGVSDGFNDETTFTVTLELKPTGRESLNRRDPYSGYMDFEIPLRSIKALIIKTLRGLSLKGSWDGSKAILTPVLEGKVFTPRSVSYKDEFGNTVKGYKDKRVNFDVYMQWSRTASEKTASTIQADAVGDVEEIEDKVEVILKDLNRLGVTVGRKLKNQNSLDSADRVWVMKFNEAVKFAKELSYSISDLRSRVELFNQR